jgi:hypothetical protein
MTPSIEQTLAELTKLEPEIERLLATQIDQDVLAVLDAIEPPIVELLESAEGKPDDLWLKQMMGTYGRAEVLRGFIKG